MVVFVRFCIADKSCVDVKVVGVRFPLGVTVNATVGSGGGINGVGVSKGLIPPTGVGVNVGCANKASLVAVSSKGASWVGTPKPPSPVTTVVTVTIFVLVKVVEVKLTVAVSVGAPKRVGVARGVGGDGARPPPSAPRGEPRRGHGSGSGRG